MKRGQIEQRFWDEAFLVAWDRCIEENGLHGAIGCAHLAKEGADQALRERRDSQRKDKGR